MAKEAAIRRIASMTSTNISADALLDIQVKRIHEYKRQLLNVLGIIHRYDELRKMSTEQRKEARARWHMLCCAARFAVPARLAIWGPLSRLPAASSRHAVHWSSVQATSSAAASGCEGGLVRRAEVRLPACGRQRCCMRCAGGASSVRHWWQGSAWL